MEGYRTEEEQVEALKRWWAENGRSTVAAIALAIAAGFGWQAWQENRQQVAAEASSRYDTMIEAVRQAGETGNDDELRGVAEGIKADFPDSTYAQFAALHLARLDVAASDLENAEAELRWVLTRNPEPEIRLVAELRLARVIAAQGRTQEALDIVQGVEAGAYGPAYAEAEGDFQRKLGDPQAALAAYERARVLAAASRSGPSDTLQLKLNALSPVPARELAPSEE